jgi:hypothetical protein
MIGRGVNVLVNPINATCSGSRCVHFELLFGWSENCVFMGILAREFIWFVCLRDIGTMLIECTRITYLQRARFVIKNRIVLAQVTSALLCVMCYVCVGFFGKRGITHIVVSARNFCNADLSGRAV